MNAEDILADAAMSVELILVSVMMVILNVDTKTGMEQFAQTKATVIADSVHITVSADDPA